MGRRADRLKQVVKILQADEAFMQGAREGYAQVLRGETISLEEVQRKYDPRIAESEE